MARTKTQIQMGAEQVRKNKASKKAAEQVVAQEPVLAQVVAPVKVTPESKRGNSTVKFPVGVTWVTCHNLFTTARTLEAPAPTRGELMKAVTDLGVGYYTARTQIQAYLAASKNGTEVPTKLPRNVALTSTEEPAATAAAE